jgi:hypothetical protein
MNPALITLSLILPACYAFVTQGPLGEGICHDNDGGMFGYSMALASDSDTTILAVGKPWDCSVHIYKTITPPPIDLSLNNTNLTDFQFQNVNWSYVGYVSDTNNGTWPTTPYSLFGYSVSMTSDGKYLAVGIPGRSRTQNPLQLEQKSFAGEVRLYKRRQDFSYELHSIVRNPNAGSQFWQKFGSKVQFQTALNRTFLVVSANHGWDGTTIQYKRARPGNPQFPIGPTTNVFYAGLYIYEFIDDDDAQSVSYLQFIRQKSSVPMGTQGIDFYVSGDSNELKVLMRDYLNYGCVVEYRFNQTSDLFYEVDTFSGYNFTLPLDVVPNNGYSFNSWEKTDWFGLGISYVYDPFFNRHIMAIGAPKDGTGLYTFFKRGNDYYEGLDNDDIENSWNSGDYILSDAPYRESSFGVKHQFSPSGHFLVVSNPTGSGMSKGKGEVSLYYRQTEFEKLYPTQFNLRIPNNLKYPEGSTPPYSYAKIAQLTDGKSTGNSTKIVPSDHFGYGLAVNEDFVIIGAPASSCFYSYRIPLVQQVSKLPPRKPPSITTKIIKPPATTTMPERPAQESGQTSSQAWMYGVIAGVVVLCVLAPVTTWFIMRRHKQKVLAQLQSATPATLASDESLQGPTAHTSEEQLNQ